ncbi:MAG: T9SS type A sorting domain-containing protein [Gelidibacter sp.]
MNDNVLIPGHDDIDDDNNDWIEAPANMPMAPGQGFAATVFNSGMFPGTRQITFDGPYNTGTITTPIFYNGPNGDNDWNLIGNPYPSAISFNDLYDNNSAFIDGAAYLWSHSIIPPSNTNNGNEAQNFRDDYAIINRFVGNVAGGSGVTPDPGNFIPSGQSFFVKGLSNGNVTFTNDMRMADVSSNNQFFRSGITQPNKLWVNLTSNNGVLNQILVGYVDGATNGEDSMAYDTTRNLSSGVMSALYTIIDSVDDKKFAIQGKNPNSLTLDEVIPLGFYTSITEPTTYKLSIANIQGEFLTTNTVYLKDNLLNITFNLSASDYIFSSLPGEFNNRFEIVFRDQALSVTDNEITPSGLSIIELPDGRVKFNVGNNLDIKSVEIMDMLGRTLYNLKGDSPSEIYDLSNISQAAYLAKVTLSNGQVITKRAVKRN